jgi:hypothetical protein
MNSVYAYCIPLPKGVKGVTIPWEDSGDYTVFVNASLCEEVRKRVLEHELRHIKYDHFCDMTNICVAEKEANVG